MVQSWTVKQTIKLVTVIPRHVFIAVYVITAGRKNGVFQTMKSQKNKRPFVSFVLAASFAAGAICTGCQTSVGGQTLPSAYYLRDDVQYFQKGPEFKLAREAAALKEARAEAMKNR